MPTLDHPLWNVAIASSSVRTSLRGVVCAVLVLGLVFGYSGVHASVLRGDGGSNQYIVPPATLTCTSERERERERASSAMPSAHSLTHMDGHHLLIVQRLHMRHGLTLIGCGFRMTAPASPRFSSLCPSSRPTTLLSALWMWTAAGR